MSFGASSANAIRALNRGAALGGFAHDTGEGGYSPHHREGGGDVIWEIGSGYFGCRTLDGRFDPERFRAVAANEQIKMIEIKLSQGAKPGHGGVLPGRESDAGDRRDPRGASRARTAFRLPATAPFRPRSNWSASLPNLRRLSGGKPVGFKLCVGHPWEFLGVCKAMVETGITPDFIVVDGMEGGTGAAPLEFADHLGMPMREGLVFVRNALIGINARDRIRIGCSGKIVNGFDIARAFALGADWCNAARGFMFALGCIQSHELPHRRMPDRRRDPGPDACARACGRGQDGAGAPLSTPRCCMRSPNSPPPPGSNIRKTSSRSIFPAGSAQPSR